MRPFSELECFVLGLVWRHGPCSAYDVRRRMQHSPSTQWSGSAGAIYPLMQRLQRQGLVASKAERTGKRRRREYTVTSRGVGVLKGWIGPPLAPEAITVTYDPLRSRARFLGVMSAAERRAWVDAAHAALDRVEINVARWAEAYRGDAIADLINRHGELDLRWRRRWLDELEAALEQLPRTSTHADP